MINAVGETLAEKPSFRVPFKMRRCLIPATGYCEWLPTLTKTKQPYYVNFLDQKIYSYAGLWERWEGDEVIESFAIITVPANDTIKPLHPRMPAILHPAEYALWLNPDTPQEALQTLLKTCSHQSMTYYPVSTRVNSPKYNDPECIVPIALPHLLKFKAVYRPLECSLNVL